MALGTSRTMWDSTEAALVVLCVLLLCCNPPLAGCYQGRWKTQWSGVCLGNGVKGWRKGRVLRLQCWSCAVSWVWC